MLSEPQLITSRRSYAFVQAMANRGLQTAVAVGSAGGGGGGGGPVGSVAETTRRSPEGGGFVDERVGMAERGVGGYVVLACVVTVLGSLFGRMVGSVVGPVVALGPVGNAAPAPTLADMEGVDAPVPVFDGIERIGTTRSHAMPS